MTSASQSADPPAADPSDPSYRVASRQARPDAMPAAWVRRNCRHVVFAWRPGAGGILWRLRIRRTVEAPTRWPSLSSSPCTLRYPQPRFSVAIRTTNAAIASLIGGRPGVFG